METGNDQARTYSPALHALLFALAVIGIAAAAAVKTRSFEPNVDRAVLDGRMAHDFESHYDQAFPARSFGISLWAAIDYALFHEAQTGVIVGKDGWLYTDEEFKVDDGAAARVEGHLAEIARLRDRLAAQQVRLVVAVVPAKARVYPEHLRGRVPPALHAALYARARQALRENGIAQADLLTPLSAGKSAGPTFLRTDTHWTPRGAALAAQAIAGSARTLLPAPDAPAAYATAAGAAVEHRGDLLNFLPLDPYFAWLLPPAERVAPPHTEGAAGGDLFGEAAAPRVALVGTSYSANPDWNFAGALEQALGEDVANYARDGLGPFEPLRRYLDSRDFATTPPQLVIWEIPERYLAVDAQPAKPVSGAAKAPADGPAAL